MDNAPMSIITIDKSGIITSANKYYRTFSKTKDFFNHSIFKSNFFNRDNLLEDYRKLLADGTFVKRENCWEKNSKGEDKYLKIIAVPLRDKDGNIEGALSMALDNTETVLYKNELEKLNRELEIRVKERTIELEEANKELEHLNTYDVLTGLYNRNFFERRLQEFRKRKILQGGVLMIDINNLKKTNDMLGHAAGDRLIKQTAKCIAAEFREHDTVARIGGDEFCVLLSDMKPAKIDIIIRRIRQKMHDAQKQKKNYLNLSISIGAAYTLSGKDLDKALKTADAQMYKNKIAMKKA